jgi:YggT family protein
MQSILQLILVLLQLYSWALIISIVLTWLVQFNVVNTSNRLVYAVGDFLYRITEPLLAPIRRFLPSLGGMDLSPLVLLLAIFLLRNLLVEYWPM